MPYFFTRDEVYAGATATLEGDEAHHVMRVRRYTPGDTIVIQDMNGTRGLLSIEQIERGSVRGTIIALVEPPPPPALHITLVQAVTKKSALEQIAVHATELGATRIVFFQADHSPHTLSPEQTRWERIVREACKQSERQQPPTIEYAASLAACAFDDNATIIALDHSGGETFNRIPTPRALMLVIGPEGGLSTNERAYLAARGAHLVRFGPRTLRAETAALASLAAAMAYWGDAA